KEAARYNPDNTFNYGSNNVWNPLPFCTAPEAITINQANGVISWTSAAHAAGYLLYKNGNLLANTTGTTYTDAAYTANDVYSVIAYNAYGAMGSPASAGTGIIPFPEKSGFLKSVWITDALQLQNANDFSSLEIINLNGQKIMSVKITGSSIDVSTLKTGYYLVKGLAKTGSWHIDKIIKR
ncbi:MAG: T9SS type A sorting domain-containing protein, partial [Dysgonamonadaceae bacterium]|nr:T9SS type A sorting domain-containing protein [Dysgonamonadaceae bacterium]